MLLKLLISSYYVLNNLCKNSYYYLHICILESHLEGVFTPSQKDYIINCKIAKRL